MLQFRAVDAWLQLENAVFFAGMQVQDESVLHGSEKNALLGCLLIQKVSVQTGSNA